ncbi:MAG TPA: hypothetical protein VFX16_22310 [Pseudonocardiaceae bacterium]|nr:hypothetical protein [Pseudonocardiaceae bacterium]
MNSVEDEVGACVRELLDAGWQVRPNPVVTGWCDVQLSITYQKNGYPYVAIVVLRPDAHSLVLNAEARYNPLSPYESFIVSERTLPITEVLRLALELTDEICGRTRSEGPLRH